MRASWNGWLPAVCLALPLAAVLPGSRVPQELTLNLGPGDTGYLEGFAPLFEIDDRVATHWSGYEARLRLPLGFGEGPVELSYRLARVLPEMAVVEVRAAGEVVDRFSCRGGAILERRVVLAAQAGDPVEAVFLIDSHDRRNLGLRFDWVRWRTSGTGLRLAGWAALRPALLTGLLLGVMLACGFDLRRAALLALPWSLATAAGVLWHPWLTHRLLTGVPEALALLGVALALLARVFDARRPTGPPLRWAVALALFAFLARGVALNHPDYYYPDLTSHARVVEIVRDAGWDMLRRPAAHMDEQTAWKHVVFGKAYVMPYSVAFHAPLALTSLSRDQLLTAVKLASAATSVVPIVALWLLARQVGASPLGAVLLVFVPGYGLRLSLAFAAALFGHAVDMAYLTWLQPRLGRIATPAALIGATLLFAACQLAYVSAVIVMPVFFAVLAAATGMEPGDARRRRAAALLAVAGFGSLVAFVAYYRGFSDLLLDVAPLVLGGASPDEAHREAQSFFSLAVHRSHAFLGAGVPLLALPGLWLLLRASPARALLTAWAITYPLLLLGRARYPDVFVHPHDALFVTPLACLAAAEATSRLGDRSGRWKPLVVALVVAALAVEGLLAQWRALAAQLGNAL